MNPDEPWAESGAVKDPRTCEEIDSVTDRRLDDSANCTVLAVPSVADEIVGCPPAAMVAVTVGVVERLVVTGAFVPLEPAGIVTLAGTTADDVVDESRTTNPNDGAGPSSVRPTVAVAPPKIEGGLTDNTLIFGWLMVRLPLTVALCSVTGSSEL